MGIFEEYLADYYYFNEFNDFYMDNFRKKEDKIPSEFIKMHIDRSFEDKNHRNYAINTHVMVKLFDKKEKYKMMLEYVLKNYCINLNPVWRIDDLQNHGGFPLETYNYLILLMGKLGKNRIISAYFVIWDSFNFEKIIVPKYIGYRYLKDILHLKDYSKIINELRINYYFNEDLKIKKITQKTLFDF